MTGPCIRLSCVSSTAIQVLSETYTEGAASCSQVDGLRGEVERLLLRKIEEPSVILGRNEVVEAMLRLLSHDGF